MKKCLLLVIVLCASVFQLYAQSSPSRIEKRSFSGIGEIHFEHSYGNISVTESDSGQTELEIQYFEKEEVKPVCETSTTGNVLTVKTVYPKVLQNKRHGYATEDGNIYYSSDHGKIKIDYIIAIPKNVAMKVDLKYGNINMGDFYGDFTCDLKYGNLNAGTFFNSPVNIEGKYSNFNIDKTGTLNFSIDYANVKINEADALNIQSKYSNYKTGKVGTLKADCSYGNINIDSVDELEVQSKYVNYKTAKVGTVKADCSYGSINIDSVDELDAKLRYAPMSVENLGRKLNLDCSYSGTKINSTSGQLKSVKFSGRYSDLRLSLDPDLSADFNADLKYGNLSIDDKYGFKYSLSEKDHNRTVKKGTFGNKTPTAKIDISASYSDISIK